MQIPQRWLYILLVILAVLAALALRLRAVDLLPIDYDEDDYLRAGQHYAAAMRAGDWGELALSAAEGVRAFVWEPLVGLFRRVRPGSSAVTANSDPSHQGEER